MESEFLSLCNYNIYVSAKLYETYRDTVSKVMRKVHEKAGKKKTLSNMPSVRAGSKVNNSSSD